MKKNTQLFEGIGKRRFSILARIGGLLLLGLLFAGCSSEAATPTPAPTVTPLPPATATVLPTATAVPTNTPISTETAVSPQSSADNPSYAADIQPIFTERCIKCHSGENPPRGLRLIDYESVLQGGTYRAVITPGDAAESELARRIRGEAIPRMPFDGPPFLEDEQIALIEAWIAAGALDN